MSIKVGSLITHREHCQETDVPLNSVSPSRRAWGKIGLVIEEPFEASTWVRGQVMTGLMVMYISDCGSILTTIADDVEIIS